MRQLFFVIASVLLAQGYANPSEFTHLTSQYYSQGNYDKFMGCMGKFEGGFDLINHMRDRAAPEHKSFYTPHIERGEGINENSEDTRENLATFIPHINLTQGQAEYDKARAGFDDLYAETSKIQWDYFKQNGRISADCIEVYKLTRELYLTGLAAQENQSK